MAVQSTHLGLAALLIKAAGRNDVEKLHQIVQKLAAEPRPVSGTDVTAVCFRDASKTGTIYSSSRIVFFRRLNQQALLESVKNDNLAFARALLATWPEPIACATRIPSPADVVDSPGLLATHALSIASSRDSDIQVGMMTLLVRLPGGIKDEPVDNFGLRPIHLACRDNHPWLIDELTKLGADLNMPITHSFVRPGFPRYTSVRFCFLSNTASPTSSDFVHDRYVRRKASDGEHDVSPELRHPAGSTTLHMACLSRQLEIVQKLVAQGGIDLEARDSKGTGCTAIVFLPTRCPVL